MRAFWKQDGVISLKLRDDLYSLAQMVNSIAKMRFYNIFKAKDEWLGTDFNQVESLFCVSVGNVVIQRLGVRRVPPKEVTPSSAPCERHFIHLGDNADGYRLRGEFIWKCGRLADLGEGAQTVGYQAPTLIPDLTVKEHREIILQHECTNMFGDRNVSERLLHYHETGVNRNCLKEAAFPDLVTNDTRPDRQLIRYRAMQYECTTNEQRVKLPPGKEDALRAYLNLPPKA